MRHGRGESCGGSRLRPHGAEVWARSRERLSRRDVARWLVPGGRSLGEVAFEIPRWPTSGGSARATRVEEFQHAVGRFGLQPVEDLGRAATVTFGGFLDGHDLCHAFGTGGRAMAKRDLPQHQLASTAAGTASSFSKPISAAGVKGKSNSSCRARGTLR